jgi:hypothetical protein
MTDYRKLRLTAAVILLMYLPAFVAVAWTYAYFAPREFYSQVVIEVRWSLVEGNEFRTALRDTAWNYRPNEVRVQSAKGSEGPIAGSFGSTLYTLGVFSPRADEAQKLAGQLYQELNRRFNETYFKRLGAYVPISIDYTPIKVWEGPQLPLVPSRPNVLHVMRAGAGIGVAFALIGLLLLFTDLRSARYSSAKVA